MNIFLSIVIVVLIAALIWIIYAARTKIRGLHEENGQMAERIRGLARQLTIESLHGQASKLSIKLDTARAPVAAQIERYKHQNNEMRVMMNRLHRHLSGLEKPLQEALIAQSRAILDMLIKRAAASAEAAFGEWKACNNWLSANKIEPYLGDVPGVPQKDVAQG